MDPELGDCLVYVPDSSPLRGAGVDDADIRANVIFLYEGGVETRTRHWDLHTGAFPCGAMVPGVNDVAGRSLPPPATSPRARVCTKPCS